MKPLHSPHLLHFPTPIHPSTTTFFRRQQRILARESHLLDLRKVDPFEPTSNFQDIEGNYLPRTRSHQHVMSHYDGSEEMVASSSYAPSMRSEQSSVGYPNEHLRMGTSRFDESNSDRVGLALSFTPLIGDANWRDTIEHSHSQVQHTHPPQRISDTFPTALTVAFLSPSDRLLHHPHNS